MVDMSPELCFVRWVLPLALLVGCGNGSGDRADAGAARDAADGSGGSGTGDAGPGGPVVITPVSPSTSVSYEGTYALDSFTVNTTACDVEGPAETSTRDATFVMAGGPSGQPMFLGLAACSDTFECVEKAADIRAGYPISANYVLLLTDEVNANLLRDGSTYPGYYVDGACTGRKWYASELTRSGDRVRVETRTIPLADLPSATTTCESPSPAALRQEVQGRPCSALRVIVGTKTGPLP